MAKLILTQEVAGLGTDGDVVEVKNGYARNYLLPRGFATVWTKGGEKQVESLQAARAARAAASLEDAQAQAAKLQSATVRIDRKAGEEGRLFGAVTVSDIASAIAATSGEQVDKRTIVVDHPIKSLGAHEVSVKLHDDVSATVSLNIVAG